MTISTELQERYTSECDIDWRAAFVVAHPRATTRFLVDHTEQVEGYWDGALRIFEPVPTKVVPPARDSTGRSEMSLVWCGIQDEALTFLNEAIADGTIPITCYHSVFILGDPNPQIDPWFELNLVNVAISEEAVAATATRADIINRPFPNQKYRVSAWPGLRRR